MPSFTFKTSFSKNTDLLLSPQDIKNNYLFGVNIKDQYGQSYPDENFTLYIKDAQTALENYLGLKFKKQLYSETITFQNDEWMNWGYMRTNYPVVCPIALEGFLNKTKQVSYPKEWLVAKQDSSGVLYHRNMYIVPVGDASLQSQSTIFTGLIPQLGYMGSNRIPMFWTVDYVTGFDEVPGDIINTIGMMASFGPLGISGDLILGSAGVTSQSIGLDGLSQSFSKEGSGYGSRLKQYRAELNDKLPKMRDFYRGFQFMVA